MSGSVTRTIDTATTSRAGCGEAIPLGRRGRLRTSHSLPNREVHLHADLRSPDGGTLLIAYPSRRFQSSWMGIIVHSTASMFSLIFVLPLVLK
jgi:hypothetical protein